MEQLLINIKMVTPQGIHTEYTTECWKKIPDWPYEVSSLGRIRHIREDQYNWKSCDVLKGGNLPRGYKIITLSRRIPGGRKQSKCFSWHKLVANAFLGPCPEGMEIDHKDSDPSNNCPDNLRYVVRSHNIQHSVANGHRGTSRWNAKLNATKVRHIREMYANGSKVKFIAETLSISESSVYHVVRGDNWRHVK